MKIVFGIVLVLLAAFSQVFSLECYVGLGNKYDEEPCPTGLDTCTLLVRKPIASRSCMTKNSCDDIAKQCKAIGCQMTCCQTDLCNEKAKKIRPLWYYMLKFAYTFLKT